MDKLNSVYISIMLGKCVKDANSLIIYTSQAEECVIRLQLIPTDYFLVRSIN